MTYKLFFEYWNLRWWQKEGEKEDIQKVFLLGDNIKSNYNHTWWKPMITNNDFDFWISHEFRNIEGHENW